MLLNNPRREKVHTSERCQGCALRQERLAVAAIRALLLATSACATQLPPHSRQHRPCVAWAAPRSPRAAELAPPRRGEERRGEERRGEERRRRRRRRRRRSTPQPVPRGLHHEACTAQLPPHALRPTVCYCGGKSAETWSTALPEQRRAKPHWRKPRPLVVLRCLAFWSSGDWCLNSTTSSLLKSTNQVAWGPCLTFGGSAAEPAGQSAPSLESGERAEEEEEEEEEESAGAQLAAPKAAAPMLLPPSRAGGG
ncbi:unnamed protein product [Prorocentrum cordatum]|uniref:Uncharacterized protein n=1 Tax=Prorocentrum cordatum TaxID=2364126 RepID=A0ABN9XWS9_9DINO|nr:unnamed protein product [Polarella glacialis]